MGCRPGLTTDIAELVFTFAYHVIASLIFLYYDAALFAFSIVQILLEKQHLLGIAWPRVNRQQAH